MHAQSESDWSAFRVLFLQSAVRRRLCTKVGKLARAHDMTLKFRQAHWHEGRA
jgi:hypothetical protein